MENKFKLKFNSYEIVLLFYFISNYVLGAFFKYNHYVSTILLLAMTICLTRNKGFSVTKQYGKFLKLFSGFTFWMVLSYLWTKGNIEMQQQTIVAMVEVWVMVLCLGSYLKSKKELINLCIIFIISTFIMAIFFYVTSPIDTWGTTQMGAKLNIWRNSAGYYFGFAAIIAMLLYYFGIKKVTLILLSIFFAVVAIATGSRKVFIQLFLAAFLYLIFQPNFKKVFRNVFIAFLILLILIPIIMRIPEVQEFYYEKFLAIFEGENSNDSSTIVRSLLQEYAIKLFAERPLIGSGVEGFRIYLKEQIAFLTRWSLTETYSHCNYTELLANYGLIGFFLYYFYPLKALIQGWKNRKDKLAKNGLILLISVLVLDYASVTYYFKYCILVFVIAIACIQIGVDELTKNEQEK